MPRRRLPLPPLLAVAVALSGPLYAAPFGKGPLDHSLCCGPRGPSGAHDPSADNSRAELFANDSDAATRQERRVPLSAGNPLPGANLSTPAPAAPVVIRIPGPPLSALDGPLETVSGYAKIAFSQLAGFTVNAPNQPLPTGTIPPDILAQVPASIQRLDGKKVVLTGFMLPTKLENGFATEFFFMSSSQLCCFGVTPAVNEWMLVKMRKEGLPAVQDVPVSLAGRLRIRVQWTEGVLASLYELEGDGLLKTK